MELALKQIVAKMMEEKLKKIYARSKKEEISYEDFKICLEYTNYIEVKEHHQELISTIIKS